MDWADEIAARHICSLSCVCGKSYFKGMAVLDVKLFAEALRKAKAAGQLECITDVKTKGV